MRDFIKKLLLIAVFALVILNFRAIMGGVGVLFGIVFPLLLGAVIAFVLNIFVSRLEKIYFPKSRKDIIKKTRRPVCIILSLVMIVAIFAGIIMVVVPELGRSFSLMAKEIPAFAQNTIEWLNENSADMPELREYLVELQESWPEIVKSISDYISNGISGLFSSVMGVLGAVTSGVINFAVGLIFGIYILMNKEKLSNQISRILKAYIPEDKVRIINYVFGTVNECFTSFIVGQCAEAVIIGVLCAVGMAVLRFPYAVMIGTVIGATALVPMIGAYLGAFVGAFLILTVSPIKSVLFIVFIIILQQLEGNLIYPRVVGSSIGLPGMWVLAAVTIGGGMGGVAGMLIGVPVAASAYKLLSNDVSRRIRDNSANRNENRNKNGKERSEETVSREDNNTETETAKRTKTEKNTKRPRNRK